MAEKTQTQKTESKKAVSESKPVAEKKIDVSQVQVKANDSVKTEAAVANDATKTETKKEVKKEISKKDEAVARGMSIRASKRHCMYICNFIKGKKVDQAMAELEQVVKMKRAIPFKGEIPHRKGSMMAGRYPVNAAKIFITMLKGLKGNIIVNQMDLDKTVIVSGVSNWASRPPKKAGGKAKRTNVTLIAREAKK